MVEFSAYLAGTGSSSKWLSVGADGDARIVLECSATELAQVMRLATLGGKLLRITIEPQS